MSGFTHLHLHTEYSLLDGACRIENLLDTAKEIGQNSVAITDHGVMYGAIDFYKAAKKKGIKPIIGCEVYVAARTRFDKEHGRDSERNHLVLLCKNNEGYKNLIKIVSEAWVTGFYTKPRIDKELLEKYHEGLICLSACLAGEIPQALLNDDYEKAKETALWYNNLFGQGNYYLEIQNHGLPEQLKINPQIIQLSKETGIPLVATNDTHYVKKEDAKIQKVLICIQTNHTINESTGLEFSTDEFYLKTEEEMLELFPDVPEAIYNTQVIADACNMDFEFGNTKLPHFEVPDGIDHFTWFSDMCHKGMIKRYGENPPKEYYDRLNYELDIINRMGYVDYYLIVHDFINYAKSQGIPVGPGRGSGAGSIAAYTIGITGIDPMKYNLLFERFLNPERVSMPDFDIDFCYVRRPEVIDYVVKKYGADHVAQIVTFGTLAARAALRDVGRALGIPYTTVDTVAKLIPRELNITIEKSLEKSFEFRSQYDSSSEIKELIDTAKKVEGMPRHASTHAAGVVITRDCVDDYVPLALNDEAVVTQFPMTTLEELGLLKMDFLGLRTLTVISDAEKMIRRKVPDFSIDNVDISDKETFEMLSSGQTDGVFQYESPGMKSVLVGLKPESLEDLIAVISLYRPGPMDSIPTYIRNRHNPQLVKYATPMLKDILDVTYGCMVYQEQVMQIFRTLAGYSYGRADLVRRAMSKKKHDVMEKERKNFIYGLVNDDGTVECEGAVKRGVPADVANKIFDEMSAFASYAFNKSHAAAYAYVSYQTAYLKCHYPSEFMAALLSSFLDDTTKISGYIAECSKINIKILPPDVNHSDIAFTVSDDGSVRFGLLAIKNIGRNLITAIIDNRKQFGKFVSLQTFCNRMFGKGFNRRAIESLIKSGAFDSFKETRRQMLTILPLILDDLERSKNKNISGQMGFFDEDNTINAPLEITLPDVGEYSTMELLSMEKETTGIYLSGHPMSDYSEMSEKMQCATTLEILQTDSETDGKYKDNSKIRLLGIISKVKKKITKSNNTMVFLTLEDTYGSIEVLVFPNLVMENPLIFREGGIVLINGRISIREDQPPSIVCESIMPAPSLTQAEAPKPETPAKKKKHGLFLRVSSKDDERIINANKMLAFFSEGTTPVYYYYIDTKEYKMSEVRTTQPNRQLINRLSLLLGGENVVLQE